MGASKQAVVEADSPVADGPESGGSAGAKRLRTKGSGGIFLVRDGVWRVDVEVGRDTVTRRRRRVSRQVEGSRRDAEAALARLKVAAEQRKVTSGRASARSVRAVLDLYLEAADAGTIELAPRTLLTSRSAANTMCSTRLLDNRTFGCAAAAPVDVARDRGDVRRDADRGRLVGLGASLCDRVVAVARLRPQARTDRQLTRRRTLHGRERTARSRCHQKPTRSRCRGCRRAARPGDRRRRAGAGRHRNAQG